jgi:hypothetical protein
MGAKAFSLMQTVSAAMAQRVHNLTLSHAGWERNARLVVVASESLEQE